MYINDVKKNNALSKIERLQHRLKAQSFNLRLASDYRHVAAQDRHENPTHADAYRVRPIHFTTAILAQYSHLNWN